LRTRRQSGCPGGRGGKQGGLCWRCGRGGSSWRNRGTDYKPDSGAMHCSGHVGENQISLRTVIPHSSESEFDSPITSGVNLGRPIVGKQIVGVLTSTQK
jgi:hypothetical protein